MRREGVRLSTGLLLAAYGAHPPHTVCQEATLGPEITNMLLATLGPEIPSTALRA